MLIFRSIRRFRVLPSGVLVAMILTALAVTAPSSWAEEGPIVVVALGDSITAGVSNDPTAVPYPTQLQNMLGGGYQVENSGNPSQTTMWLLSQFASQVTAKNPDVVVILAGVNDINLWDQTEASDFSPAKVIDRLRQMGNQVNALGASAIYMTIWPDNDFSSAKVDAIHEINNWIMGASATEVAGSQAIDMAGQLLAQTGNTDLLDDAYHDGTHLHLNQPGYTKVAQTAASVIVPEPGSVTVMGLGGLVMMLRRRTV